MDFFGQPGFAYPPVPVKESASPISQPFADGVFYYDQRVMLENATKNANWSFIETRPDVIIGFTPQNNFLGVGMSLGLYLSLYRHVHGEGSRLPFPGPEIVWTSKRTDTAQKSLAQFNIFLALHPDNSKWSGMAFNIADDEVVTWKDGLWKDVCSYFGLEGVGPETASIESARPQGVEWVMASRDEWSSFIQSNDIRADVFEKVSWSSLVMALNYSVWDRQLDIELSRTTGFTGYSKTADGYRETFQKMREAHMIP
jgi:hypothetical protein